MKEFFIKQGRFENILTLLFSFIGLVYGLIKADWLGYLVAIVAAIIIISKVIFITIFKKRVINRILYLSSLLILLITLIDFIIVGIIQSFITAAKLTKAEAALRGLNIRLAYICIKNYKSILMGVFTTVWLSLAGTVIGLILGLIFISFRTLEVSNRNNEIIAFLKIIARGFVKIYVTIFRGTPMMVQAIIIYYFLPGILANIFNVDQQVMNSFLSVGIAGLITVSLNTAAYLTEVLRAGVESLNSGQMEAARSLGMSRFKAMFYVILPQGIRNSLPSICNEFIINIKDTSVLSVISVMDLFFIIDMINGKNSNSDAIFIAAIIYLCLTLGISKFLGFIERRMNLVAKPIPSSN